MKKILAPIDFSDSSINALQFAIDICKAFGTELYIIHSFDMLIEFNEAADSALIYQKYLEESSLKFGELVKDIKNKYLEINITSFFEAGSAVNAIKNKSDELHIDLIIMGRTGSSGIESIIIGSTTAKVVNHADTPVFIIPNYLSLGYMLTGTILLSTDLKTYPGTKGIKLIQDFCEINNHKIHILHYYRNEDENLYEKEAQFLSVFPEAAGIEYINKGTFLETLYFAAEKHNVKLLILISRKKTFWERLFEGQKSVKVADETIYPLLILPEGKEREQK